MSNSVMIYVRVGTQEQAEETLSKQISECKQFAEDNDMQVAVVYKDVISANRLGERFENILDEMKNQGIVELIIHNWSRVSRNVKSVYEIDQLFREQGKFIIPIAD
ncbi:recombinase family protein [Paenibacillus chitinolyticus]|uniref:recombinase family protein n=1 Tax=Paenibacillus chitinolyticus TaxID=79263 RepID=UPI0035586F7E